MPENKQNDIDVSDFEDEQPLNGIDDFEFSEEAQKAYEKIFKKDTTFWQRFGNFLTAENEAGRKAKIIKDAILVFAPWGKQVSNVTELATEIIDDDKSQTTNRPMKDKIRKLSKFFSFKDDDGNWSLKEAGYSILKVAILSGIAWGAVQLGIWNQLIELFEIIG